jgi:pyroglutamyl-peptidase
MPAPAPRRFRNGRALALVLAGLAACAADQDGVLGRLDPNAGLLRDFLEDGKFDAAGRPLNALVLEAEEACADAGPIADGLVRIDRRCRAWLPGAEQRGPVVLNLRLRARAYDAPGAIVRVRVESADGGVFVDDVFDAARLRASLALIDLPLAWTSDGTGVLVIEPLPGGEIDLDYVELFPRRFTVAVAPGSGVMTDRTELEIETDPSDGAPRIRLDGVDIGGRLATLLAEGRATAQETAYRRLVRVAVGDLLPDRRDVSELRVDAGDDAARLQIRRAPAPCLWEGDPAGRRVLVTVFQDFPADGWHANVSQVAVDRLRFGDLAGVAVMRLTLPVEFDLAPAIVADAIARCRPERVVSFGQGGDELALERRGHNLKDTSEVAGGVPDNRGRVEVAAPIDPLGPATRDTLVPIDRVQAALRGLGETAALSDDPGRYVCNDVYYATLGATTVPTLFVHLPYTERFPLRVRNRWSRVATTVVRAMADLP